MAVLIDENTKTICQGHHTPARMTRGISSRSLRFQVRPGQGFDGVKLTGKGVVLLRHQKLITVADVQPEREARAESPAQSNICCVGKAA